MKKNQVTNPEKKAFAFVPRGGPSLQKNQKKVVVGKKAKGMGTAPYLRKLLTKVWENFQECEGGDPLRKRRSRTTEKWLLHNRHEEREEKAHWGRVSGKGEREKWTRKKSLVTREKKP